MTDTSATAAAAMCERLTEIKEWAADCGWHNHCETASETAALIAALQARIKRLEAALRNVLPYTEAERLAEAAALRCGATRDPIRKAVEAARAALQPASEGA